MTDAPIPCDGCCPSSLSMNDPSVMRIIGRVGDKWSILIIMQLFQEGRRFNELKRRIDGVSQRMLTLSLRNLERDGLVTRHVTPLIPPRVDYELTEMGRSLAGPVQMLGLWALDHADAIEAAQLEFDKRLGQ